MYTNKYVAVFLGDNDLYTDEFDDYEEALKAVNATDNKAYIIRAENICMDGYPPFKLTVEPHT